MRLSSPVDRKQVLGKRSRERAQVEGREKEVEADRGVSGCNSSHKFQCQRAVVSPKETRDMKRVVDGLKRREKVR